MGSICSSVVFSYNQVSLLLEVGSKGKYIECLPNARNMLELRARLPMPMPLILMTRRAALWPCLVSNEKLKANRAAVRIKWHNGYSTQRGSRIC